MLDILIYFYFHHGKIGFHSLAALPFFFSRSLSSHVNEVKRHPFDHFSSLLFIHNAIVINADCLYLSASLHLTHPDFRFHESAI